MDYPIQALRIHFQRCYLHLLIKSNESDICVSFQAQ
jgi:hypothetical protein